MTLKSEIFEQPQILARLLEKQMPHVEELARILRRHEIDFIFLTARGTSDNAGLYAKYLWGCFNQLPIALAAPSLYSIYGSGPRLKNALVVAISQSGQSPDILSVVSAANDQGTPTLAITNSPDSPLGQAASYVIDACAGLEKAVAATKTYTAQLMAIAMLSAALSEDQERRTALEQAPSLVQQVLALDARIEQVAERYRYMTECVILGRGYNYATAFEWSLKLKELAYVVAEPYSSADFQHGPVAIVTRGFPVFAVVPDGAVFGHMMGLLSELAKEHQAELLVISNREEALSLAHTPLPLPQDLPEWLSPLVGIVPAQLFCYHLTRARGFDTEAPRGLTKVTLTH